MKDISSSIEYLHIKSFDETRQKLKNFDGYMHQHDGYIHLKIIMMLDLEDFFKGDCR